MRIESKPRLGLREPEPPERELVREGLRRAKALLPSQPRLERFVHHNPLHALEHLSFEEAVLEASRRLGAEPYPSEAAFERFMREGRLEARDVEAVLDASLGPDEARPLPGGVTRKALRLTRLLYPHERPDATTVRFSVDEGRLFRKLDPAVSEGAKARFLAGLEGTPLPRVLAETFARLEAHAAEIHASGGVDDPERPRDRILAEYGEDVDREVQPILIRLLAVVLDAGLADASLPERKGGLLATFAAMYARRRPASPVIEGALERLVTRGVDDPEAIAVDALFALEVPREAWPRIVEKTLYAIRGWAGMVARLEAREDEREGTAPSLAELLALSLLLEAEAALHAMRTKRKRAPEPSAGGHEALAYEAFVLAQHLGLGPRSLEVADEVRAFVEEVAAFSDVERRRLWFLAYERRHAREVLSALARAELRPVEAPIAQAIFCIDDREESIRRHLEEIEPRIETFGYAGFFGVAMSYRGLFDDVARPLCPPGVNPTHVVFEERVEPSDGTGRIRAILAKLRARPGGVVRALLGLVMLVPFALRLLAPSRFAAWLRRLETPPVKTRVVFERGPEAEHGFDLDEMASIVAALLHTTGMEGRLAPLVFVIGHGATSTNNPHEAAYNCGATGGGHGGPNARVFAAMANHPGVREKLAARGVVIPERTRFVGGFHDTCSDSLVLFDLEEVGVPSEEIERFRQALDEARRRSAHERCRRFESASLALSPEEALAHVSDRAASLAEPRPECGHVTNALCIVGRRELTRGLFLDRRAFLVSYEPSLDPEGEVLGPLLETVINVAGGISLEYYFSFVDSTFYGSGTKVAHNVASLVGVMDGAGSDLRTGLPVQMVELHEPIRLLTIVEAEPATLERIIEARPVVARALRNEWVRFVLRRPSDGALLEMKDGALRPYVAEAAEIPRAPSSMAHYAGARGHLRVARVDGGHR